MLFVIWLGYVEHRVSNRLVSSGFCAFSTNVVLLSDNTLGFMIHDYTCTRYTFITRYGHLFCVQYTLNREDHLTLLTNT